MTSAAFGPGGGLLVTTGANEKAWIWRVRDGARLQELKGHRASVLDAAFSPRGTKVATASADKTGRIWNVRTGALLATVGGHKGIVHAVAFSPDGNFVVTGQRRPHGTNSRRPTTARGGLCSLGTTTPFTPWSTAPTERECSRRVTTGRRGYGTRRPAAAQLVRRTVGPLAEAEYVGSGDRILVAGPGRQALVLRPDGRAVVDSIVANGLR